MHLILCHTTADFDTLGAAVGLSRLEPGSKVVLSGGCHPTVREFLALHSGEYPFIERRAVHPEQIYQLSIVDTQCRDRLGKVAEWLDLPQVRQITLYDHHREMPRDIPATVLHIHDVGAATTLVVEQLQRQQISLSMSEATVMALGIHVDTGSLTFDHSTERDALALAWLMRQGASLRTIAEYVDPGLPTSLQNLLTKALQQMQATSISGSVVGWVLLRLERQEQGLSSLVNRLMDLTESDTLLLAVWYPVGEAGKLTIIARTRVTSLNLHQILSPLGGGGHPRAAAATVRTTTPEAVLEDLVAQVQANLPRPVTARELMSSPARTIRPEVTIAEAQRVLLRYGHSGLCVVDSHGNLVGVISRRDLDLALHHGYGHAPVKGYMSVNLKTISPDAPLATVKSLMVTYDVGRLPVLQDGHLVGIVTRTDVLRELNREQSNLSAPACSLPIPPSKLALRQRLHPDLWAILDQATQLAAQHGWHLYLVGGAVRDLLLSKSHEPLLLQDIDLVVDAAYSVIANLEGAHSTNSSDQGIVNGAGMILGQALHQKYPEAKLQIHGLFQTAALLWHHHPCLDSLWIDIATARTEFYPYPAANPEVEASSIRQDLYRRDFTINALAVQLTPAWGSSSDADLPLLDFFGGLQDLAQKQVRVLHANSFIEDPTRIYRAVRFAVRLGFTIEPQTERYIRYALSQIVLSFHHPSRLAKGRVPALETRLKNELKYILQSDYWRSALKRLAHLGALQCIHPTLTMTPQMWKQLCRVERAYCSLQLQRSSLWPQFPPIWEILLEVMLLHLPVTERTQVAENLQLQAIAIERLTHLEVYRQNLISGLALAQRPSQMVQLMSGFDVVTLLLVGVQGDATVRRAVWQYLTYWSQIRPLLNGHDLKAMGYKPGQQFRQILDALLVATLDGLLPAAPMPAMTVTADEVMTDRQRVEQYIQQNYPLP